MSNIYRNNLKKKVWSIKADLTDKTNLGIGQKDFESPSTSPSRYFYNTSNPLLKTCQGNWQKKE